MKNPLWKQANPSDQLVAINGALEGWLSCLESGTVTPQKYAENVRPLIEMIRQLRPFFEGKEKW